MIKTLTLKDESLTGDILNEILIQIEKERITVADLIEVRVRQEVESYNQKSSEYFQGLVQPSEAEQTLNGFKVKEKRKIDAEKQTYIALNAFQQNAFFVLIDNSQAESLEQEILVSDKTDVSFVKLTPLVGG